MAGTGQEHTHAGTRAQKIRLGTVLTLLVLTVCLAMPTTAIIRRLLADVRAVVSPLSTLAPATAPQDCPRAG